MSIRRVSAPAIYAARNSRIRAALPKDRSQQFCASECYAASEPTVCDQVTCWAKRVGADGRSDIYARRQLQLERGRTPTPRPRSIADVVRAHHTNQGGPR